MTGFRNRAEVVLRNMHVAAYGVYSCLRKTSRSERRVLAEILKFFKIIQFRSTFIYSLKPHVIFGLLFMHRIK